MLYVLSLCMCTGQELVETDPYLVNRSAGLTELPGGVLAGGRTMWKRDGGPYLLRDDLLIERDAELVVEPGVEVRFAPMVGITVRGKLVAVVSCTFKDEEHNGTWDGPLRKSRAVDRVGTYIL